MKSTFRKSVLFLSSAAVNIFNNLFFLDLKSYELMMKTIHNWLALISFAKFQKQNLVCPVVLPPLTSSSCLHFAIIIKSRHLRRFLVNFMKFFRIVTPYNTCKREGFWWKRLSSRRRKILQKGNNEITVKERECRQYFYFTLLTKRLLKLMAV